MKLERGVYWASIYGFAPGVENTANWAIIPNNANLQAGKIQIAHRE